MITLDMCLAYIDKHKGHRVLEHKVWPKYLSEAQKRFLGNLCEGKLTDTPRCFGKTMLIKLYCECLNYYSDMIKYGGAESDDYISLEEAMDDKLALFSKSSIVSYYERNPANARREFNLTDKYAEKLKAEVEGTNK